MTSKHTPGPWQVSGGRSKHDVYGHMVGPDGYGVAIVAYSDQKPGEHTASLADARLIAAAPDLLAAMKEVARLIDHGHVMTAATEARAAIAKAEDRS